MNTIINKFTKAGIFWIRINNGVAGCFWFAFKILFNLFSQLNILYMTVKTSDAFSKI